MITLPIDPLLPEIVERLREHRCLVLVAPPGAGKTTRVPAAIVRADLLARDHPALVLLQPRRVAARAAAARIAAENGWALGEEVGYQIRFERRIGPRTRLRVATEGTLNRQLVADPFLEGVGAVVLDEFHERSLHTDLALAFLREIQQTVREDLFLIVMSATLDAEPVARFLGGCPILRAEGRAFPVDVTYQAAARPAAPEAIAAALADVLNADAERGDVLVFLPGAEEIRRAGEHLEPLAERHDLLVLPLHGSLSGADQDRALRPSERRKVVLATNIAETSLTIDGVTCVIDSGLARQASHDPERGLDRLELGRISRASATQRAGRAGRTRPGRCVRLWSEREQRGLAETDVAEVQRVDLCGTVLALHAWGLADPGRFAWFEPPSADRIGAAERLLAMLGALSGEGGQITPLGRRLLDIPAHPRLGRLLIAAARDGHRRAGASLAALLSEKDILIRDEQRELRGRGASDLLVRLDLLNEAERDRLVRLDLLNEAERDRFSARSRARGIDPGGARRVAQVRDELFRLARRLPGPSDRPEDEPDEETMLKWLLLAYPDRVVKRRGGEATGVMVGGRGVRLGPASVVRDAELFLALDPHEQRRGGTLEARVESASALRREWLEELFPEHLRRERSIQFDDDRQRVVGVLTLYYQDIPLREERNAPVPAEAAGAALAEALRPRVAALFSGDEAAASWLARLALLRRAMPEAGWPEFNEDLLVEVLAEACTGKRGLDELQGAALLPALQARLTHAQGRMLDEHAPRAVAVPSGNRINLQYEAERPPVLAVRLQELFGWTDTPRVAAGRVPVTLHLLGPNYRPVQITDDLRSFWSSTYFQVRKDLRARYPKHSWPDDPLSAQAEARGGRRK